MLWELMKLRELTGRRQADTSNGCCDDHIFYGSGSDGSDGSDMDTTGAADTGHTFTDDVEAAMSMLAMSRSFACV